MDKFVDTFSPINVAIEDQRQQKLVYDALEAALVVTLAPGFHTGEQDPRISSSVGLLIRTRSFQTSALGRKQPQRLLYRH